MSNTLLNLIALPAEGIEPTYHRMPLTPGIHLRWSFRPDLGFPEGGFEIHRRLYLYSGGDIPTPPIPGPWEIIQVMPHPLTMLHDGSYSAQFPAVGATALYRFRIPELTQILEQITHGDEPIHERRFAPDGNRRSPFGLRIIDGLMLAALDPYIARLLGLYWVDGTAPPGRRVDYRIVGLWGNTQFPEYQADFRRITAEQIARGSFELDTGVQIFSERAIAVDNEHALHLFGAPSLQLRLTFPRPVQEVHLEVVHSEAQPQWRVHAQVDSLVSGELDLSSRINSLPGAIRIQHGQPFRRLVITDASRNPMTRWIWRSIRYRERIGAVGKIAVGTSVNASPTELEDPPAPPLPVAVRSVTTHSAPPGLDEHGRVPTTSSRVEIHLQSGSATTEKRSPVRMLVNRSEHTSLFQRPDIHLTDSPVPYFPAPQTWAFWRLDGRPDDYQHPNHRYTTVGVPGSVRFSPYSQLENPRRRYVSIETFQRGSSVSGGCLEVRGWAGMRDIGSHFGIELWVLPVEPLSGWNIFTLIDNDWRNSFWLGLHFTGGRFRIRLWLNGKMFESTQSIPAREWSRVGVRYEGSSVRFYIGGAEMNRFNAMLGPVRRNPRGDILRIGASLDANFEQMTETAYPFRGSMMNLRFERSLYPTVSNMTAGLLASWSLDGNLRDAKSGLTKSAIQTISFEQDHPESLTRRVCRFDGTNYLRTTEHPAFIGEREKLFLDLWLNPAGGQSYPTLVGNGWNHSFWLGLEAIGTSSFRLRGWINGVVYVSSGTINVNRWSRVGMGYDGQLLTFFINGTLDTVHPAQHGRIKVNPVRAITIGASAYSQPTGPLQYPFRGKIADVRLWEELPSLPSPALLIRNNGKSSSLPDFIDHTVPDGTYTYHLQSVDLFGRVAPPVATHSITVTDQLTAPPPASLRAEFVPLTGNIIRCENDRILTDMQLPHSVTADDLIGYDLEIQAIDSTNSVIRQPLTVLGTANGSDGMTFHVNMPPFPRVQPASGQRVAIHYDINLRVRWSWTGLQRLFTPRARAFRLYTQSAGLNRWQGTLVAVKPMGFNRFAVRSDPPLDVAAGQLIGLNCLVGSFMYTVEPPPSPEWHAQLRYNASPVQSPEVGLLWQLNLPESSPLYSDPEDTRNWEAIDTPTPLSSGSVVEQVGYISAETVSAQEKTRLREQGVHWITADARLYSLLLRHAGRLSTIPTTPSDYVSGGLVGFDETDGINEWKAFSVVWHEQESEEVVRLYFVHSGTSLPRLKDIRYIPGERYERLVTLTNPPRFDATRGTLEFAAALTTIDDRNKEGPLSDAAQAIAVNRRRPPAPPRPVISSIDRPDYFGTARANIRWSLTEEEDWRGVTFQLYRATDTAIYTRDMEQRRARTGAYARLSPREVFFDDPVFEAWIKALQHRLRIPDLDTRWPDTLFKPKPVGDRPQAEPSPSSSARAIWEHWIAWDAATPIWQAWAERFYPALSDDQLVDIAERLGNEAAFTLVNDTPIKELEYVDTIVGRVRNRYLYRLRTVSNALLTSAEWSLVSQPRASSFHAPPRPPVFTKLEAGDRQITLHWALNRDSFVKAYRLYRAERSEELEDLRHWDTSIDPRLAAIIPDPLIRTHSRAISLPGSIDIADVLGVYRLDEFDFEAASMEDQPGALNYYNVAPVAPADPPSRHIPAPDTAGQHIIDGLRNIPDGTPVVVVYREHNGASRYLAQTGAPPYRDEGLIGLRDYYYRLVTEDQLGQLSPGSEIIRGRPLELTKPAAPELRVEREAVTASETASQLRVKRKEPLWRSCYAEKAPPTRTGSRWSPGRRATEATFTAKTWQPESSSITKLSAAHPATSSAKHPASCARRRKSIFWGRVYESHRLPTRCSRWKPPPSRSPLSF